MAQDLAPYNTVPKPENPRPLEVGNRFSWEQLEPQLKPLGLRKDMLSPEDLRELLNARRTSSVTMHQTDQHGTVTPVQGRLFVYDDPGKGPRVELIPRQLERTPAPRYLGFQLTHEDNIRLQRTGEMGRIGEFTDKETGQKFAGMLGYDPATNRLTVFRQERFVPPTVLLGVTLSGKQQETLRNHGVIRVKNMQGKDGKPFTADVQVSAHKRGLSWKPVNQAALVALQEKRTIQQHAPQLRAPSPKQLARQQADEQWKKTVVTVKDADGAIVRKPAEQLRYSDQIRVNKTGSEGVFRPLVLVGTDGALKSPRAQAKQEIIDFRKEQSGLPVQAKQLASADAIRKAEQKFTSLPDREPTSKTQAPPATAQKQTDKERSTEVQPKNTSIRRGGVQR